MATKAELAAYQREAYRRFYAAMGEPWPNVDDATIDRAIALAAELNSLEAEHQQHAMPPAKLRVRMLKLLLADAALAKTVAGSK